MKQKTTTILYWIFTILLAGFMLFSGIMELSNGESAQLALTSLGYPIYLNFIIGIAKVLGAIAILQNKYKTVKEWAYAGFSIDFIGAWLSIIFSGGSIIQSFFMIPFLVILAVSYTFWKKREKKN